LIAVVIGELATQFQEKEVAAFGKLEILRGGKREGWGKRERERGARERGKIWGEE
jgi:hypothetical protein